MASKSSASEAVNTPSINDIDEYSLAHIFQYLSLIERTKVERVCKRWKTACREHGHMYSKRLTIGSDTGEFPDLHKSAVENVSILENILRYRGKCIQDVSFTRTCKHILYTLAMPVLSKWCSNLKRLDAQNLKVSNDNLTNLAAGCPNLEELLLGWNPLMSENKLGKFFRGAKHLKKFTIKNQTSITGKCLLKLTPGILESLHIEDCISFLLTPEIATFLDPSLTSFSYSGHFMNFTQNLENITLLPNLRRLLIRVGHGQLTKRILNNIVRSCSLLEAVDLGESLIGSEDHDITLLLNLPNLKELTIMSKMPAGENLLMDTSFEKIERLTLGCSRMMNAEDYRSLINRCPSLKYFSVCSCSLDNRLLWVVDAPRVLGRNVIVEIYFHSAPRLHIPIMSMYERGMAFN